MKFSSSVRGCVTRFLGFMVIASLLSVLLSSPATSAEPGAPASKKPAPAPNATAQPPAEESAKREDWRKAMARTPLPKNRCFTASYPSTEWQEVPCTTPPNRPYPQAQGPRPDTVGGGNDYSAQSSGTISSAVGSFASVTGVTSVSDTGPNAQSNFALQLNTNDFSANVCSSAAVPSLCQGWQQFTWSNSGSAYMQYWVYNYGSAKNRTNCPPTAPGTTRLLH
jgi:hypothetical protein